MIAQYEGQIQLDIDINRLATLFKVITYNGEFQQHPKRYATRVLKHESDLIEWRRNYSIYFALLRGAVDAVSIEGLQIDERKFCDDLDLVDIRLQ